MNPAPFYGMPAIDSAAPLTFTKRKPRCRVSGPAPSGPVGPRHPLYTPKGWEDGRCAGRVRQLGGASPLPSLMEAKG